MRFVCIICIIRSAAYLPRCVLMGAGSHMTPEMLIKSNMDLYNCVEGLFFSGQYNLLHTHTHTQHWSNDKLQSHQT